MKIWATDLETWRYWRAYDGVPATLLAKLKREEELPAHVEYGRKWHSILENAANEAPSGYSSLRLENGDAITSDYEGDARNRIRFVIDDDADIPLTTLPEQRFELAVGSHLITGRADGIYPDGNTVVEYKTSRQPPVMENYADSLQWRVYLLGTGAKACRYSSVQLFEPKHQDDPDAFVLRVRNPAEATFWRYTDMRADVEEAVASFVADADAIGWTGR